MLELGVYKNWKELCEAVGWNPNNRGNYKQARLKELDTICSWHKDGNKIIIDKIFGELSEETDKRINNKTRALNTSNIILIYFIFFIVLLFT